MNNKKALANDDDNNQLAEILKCEYQENDEPVEYFFSNQKHDPILSGQPCHDVRISKDGHIHVKNPSAFWIPELTITETIHGTVYTVSGSYEGGESFVRKLEHISEKTFADRMGRQE